jgi:nucleoside-diphosphate-sugar epimerase
MHDALIGHTGFVGTTLLRQHTFDRLYRSTNISEISGQSFEFVICAGAPAQKWIANREPAADRRNIERLIDSLKTVRSELFVLISTVDVFNNPVGVDEDAPVDERGLPPYGLNRRLLEKFTEDHFPNHRIVRLSGVVGAGLRKNVIFDFLNDNNLQAIDSRAIFQFYPMVNLWYDIQLAVREVLRLVHFTAAPISVAEAAAQGFGRIFNQRLADPAARYDFQSKYAQLFGGHGGYQYSKRETIQAIRAYAQSEPRSTPAEGGARS